MTVAFGAVHMLTNHRIDKKGLDGKVTGLWPGSSIHYMQVLTEGRWEDYKWTYERNRYSYWGQGISWIESPELDPLGLDEREWFMTGNTVARKGSDLSYYLWKAPPLPQSYIPKFEEPSVSASKTNGTVSAASKLTNGAVKATASNGANDVVQGEVQEALVAIPV